MTFRRSPVPKTAEDFITAAGTQVRAKPAGQIAAQDVEAVPLARPAADPLTSKNLWPWEDKRSDKQTEVFNLRLTEVELEKLRFIAARTPDSMQAFVRKTLLPALDAKVADLTRGMT